MNTSEHTLRLDAYFSSAIACALAKATGNPVIILGETKNVETQDMRVEYRILAPIIVSDEVGVPIIFGEEPES
jgi:hypothetical protein